MHHAGCSTGGDWNLHMNRVGFNTAQPLQDGLTNLTVRQGNASRGLCRAAGGRGATEDVMGQGRAVYNCTTCRVAVIVRRFEFDWRRIWLQVS
jgi:hypothetical protein